MPFDTLPATRTAARPDPSAWRSIASPTDVDAPSRTKAKRRPADSSPSSDTVMAAEGVIAAAITMSLSGAR